MSRDTAQYRQRGFNLIEVLIALVVLSFGLLGIAALQVTGVRGAQSSYYRSQAVALMNDMAERIYANTQGARNGAYAAINIPSTACASASPTLCGEEYSGSPSSCTPAQVAVYDAVTVACGYADADGERKGGAADMLPNGSLQVTCLNGCAADTRHEIVVSWQDRTDEDQATGLFETETRDVRMTVQP